MPNALDVVIIALIFLALIGFLVAVVLYGVGLSSQVDTLGNSLSAAFLQAYQTFQNLANSLVQTFEGLYTVFKNAFDGIVTNGRDSFASASNFVRSTLLPFIENTTQEVLDVSSYLARMIGKALVAVGAAVSSTINEVVTWVGSVVTSVTGLISRAYVLASQFVSSLIQFIVEGVTKGIIFVLGELEALFNEIAHGTLESISEITDAISSLTADISSGFNTLDGVFDSIEHAVTSVLPAQLNAAWLLVSKAVDNVFSGFLCGVVAPLCSNLPSFIAPSSLCDEIRSAGGC